MSWVDEIRKLQIALEVSGFKKRIDDLEQRQISWVGAGGSRVRSVNGFGPDDQGNISIPSSEGVTSITGTLNQVIVSSPTGSVTLSLPQDIATTSSPTFDGLTVTSSGASITGNSSVAGTLTVSSTLTASNGFAVTAGSSTFSSLSGTGDRLAVLDTSGVLERSDLDPSSLTTGSGTTNYTARWTGSSTLGAGIIQDDGVGVSIGTVPSTNGTFAIRRATAGSVIAVRNSTDSETVFGVNHTGSTGAGTTPRSNIRTVIRGASSASLNTSLRVENSSGTATFVIRDDGGFAFFGGSVGLAQTGWNPTNVTTDRTFDANSTNIDELADVLGTLINDLKAKGIISS